MCAEVGAGAGHSNFVMQVDVHGVESHFPAPGYFIKLKRRSWRSPPGEFGRGFSTGLGDTMRRNLTNSEIALVKPIFKNTLPYYVIKCDVNRGDVGGAGNSITPAGVAYFSRQIYSIDFSKSAPSDKWIFVHEMAHVWQWYHGVYPVWAALGAFLENPANYGDAYDYSIDKGKPLRRYNLEQQAAIIADYWALTTGHVQPKYNRNNNATIVDYQPLIAELQKSGAPVPHLQREPSGSRQ
jgi:hypothetical protein